MDDSLAQIQNSLNEIKAQLAPLTEAYQGILFSKKFIVGLGGAILAIGAVGAGIIWIVNAASNKP